MLRHAQTHLPEDRRREKIVAINQVPWFRDGMAALSPADEVAERHNARAAADPGEHELMPVLRDLIAEVMELRAKVEALVSHAGATPSFAVNPGAPNRIERSHLAEPTPPKPPDLRARINIVGPDADQTRLISEKVGQRAVVRILDRGRSSRRLPACDYMILTRMVGHEWWNRAVAAVGQDRVFRLDTGGIEKVVAKVYDLASRQVPGR